MHTWMIIYDSPAKWHEYHALAEQNDGTFHEDDVPRNRIRRELDAIRCSRQKQVVDLGCGTNKLAAHFRADLRFAFRSFDHVAVDPSVEVADIAHLPLPDHYAEIVVLSMAMWGTNCQDYLAEAHRVLESGGKMYVVEPTRRWSDEAVALDAARLREAIVAAGFAVVRSTIEKFALFVCDR